MATQLQVTVGEKVRAMREKRGWTQAEFARKLKMHQPDLCDLEKGRHSPKLETIEKIADAFEVGVKSLLP